MTRIFERDLETTICYVLNIEGPLTTTQLRERVRNFLEKHNELNQGDLDGLLNRNDEKIDQIIRIYSKIFNCVLFLVWSCTDVNSMGLESSIT